MVFIFSVFIICIFCDVIDIMINCVINCNWWWCVMMCKVNCSLMYKQQKACQKKKKKKVYRQHRLENGLFQNVSKIFTGSDIITINTLTHDVMYATLFF